MITDWIEEIEKSLKRFETLGVINSFENAHDKIIEGIFLIKKDIPKLLALVRMYREANRYYARYGNYSFYGNESSNVEKENGNRARAAEEKARKIVEGR